MHTGEKVRNRLPGGEAQRQRPCTWSSLSHESPGHRRLSPSTRPHRGSTLKTECTSSTASSLPLPQLLSTGQNSLFRNVGRDCPQFLIQVDVRSPQVSMDLMLTKKQLDLSPKLSSPHLSLTVYFKHHQFSNLYVSSAVYFPPSVLGRSTVTSNMSYLGKSVLLIV